MQNHLRSNIVKNTRKKISQFAAKMIEIETMCVFHGLSLPFFSGAFKCNAKIMNFGALKLFIFYFAFIFFAKSK